MSGTIHFWSRTRSRWEKRFRSGPGPVEKNILVPVPARKSFRSRSRSRSLHKQILVPVPVKKNILVPVLVKKRNLVPFPGPFCSSLTSTLHSVRVSQNLFCFTYKLIFRNFSFLCQNYNNIINLKDNLNRTPLHYAYIMNDETAINILQQSNAKKVKTKFLLSYFY